jgi:alkenylglycerophosphocholine hydrolase
MLTIALGALALLAGALAVRFRTSGPLSLYRIAKPATMALIILVALVRPGGPPAYKTLILAGLLASLAGDVFLMLDKRWFAAGLGGFLLAHVFYILAFKPAPDRPATMGTLLPFLVFGLLMFRTLAPNLGKLKLPVLVYVAAITVMAWFAAARFIEIGGWRTLAALAGAMLFLASDAVLGYARFVKDFASAQLFILGAYFPAQLLIALSI